MIYLDQDATKFLYPYLIEAKRNKHGIVEIISSANEDEVLQIRLMSETTLGIKFVLEIPNLFVLTMMSQDANIIVYRYMDAEHYPSRVLFSIDEINLLKELKPLRPFHYVFNLFTEAILNTVRDKENGNYEKQFDYYSFRSIRFLFFLFIAETDIICSWGTHKLIILNNAILFNVQGHHFTGQVKISYNAGADVFEVAFMQKNVIVGQRTGIYFDELINTIDKNVEYIPEYDN
ncbi:hypothetical protein M2451_003866 [Dysgonomonas sp. PFB1-18]|uniref:hypothetical protein n=1 Tax=unclassified Dysgonomonas TaxID=2630389 RepID=UPI0024761150|nr:MULTISPECIES: hypothetical protein [unclassified Dysgonomonas]MDH6311048.1 hypothetical protein [Dysgonomonas sp. PF1-14]MDH6341114.1 hypothetical protein [Dysgonomonas sp. PF1-16]MDH6382525.1 hypothetical protein [Dysgonomonas sp. PFB1-18]MDH6400078.1 hypothetical protein [Dysgonomonas sp. PF1-23]